MRKSSLGRRSSTHIPVRVPSIGGASGQKGNSKTSTSKLRQPGFSSQKPRAQSEDRESDGIISRPALRRSSSHTSLRGGMTPITPHQPTHSNLLPSSARPPRSQLLSTGDRKSTGRMSSVGGTKNSRKDNRPITEKAFQQEAQAKVQQFFNEFGAEVFAAGTSIRPMNLRLFVDMMDFLLKKFDGHINITKTNYLEDVPNLLRKFGYRSKIDKSWLLTVNTPHSWPHVVAVLSWLVEVVDCSNANTIDPYEMMFPNMELDNLDITIDEEGENSVPVNKDMVLHLKKCYRINSNIVPNDPQLDALDDAYIEKQIMELKCTPEDLETVQRQLELIQKDVDNEIQKQHLQQDALQKLVDKKNSLKEFFESTMHYIEESNGFIHKTKMKVESMEKEIEVRRVVFQKKQEEYQRLQQKISCQLVSVEEREKMMHEKHELYQTIQFYETSIREYENSAFSVDLSLAEDQRKLEKLIVEYNKIVAEKLVVDPRLKDLEVKYTVLSKIDDASEDGVDNHISSLKEEIKTSIKALTLKKEELENILIMVKQDVKETKDLITKEATLLEGLQCDYETQEETIQKETISLKDEIKKTEETTKKIMEDISQLDPNKLEENKLELKRLEHDYDLFKRKAAIQIQALQDHTQQRVARLEASNKKVLDKCEEILRKYQG